MKIIIWVIIILFVLFIIRLLRKWIRRLILILILLVLAFFIYGIFSPSGAAKLWYNVRTLPDRIMSWVSNKSFMDYDNYKLNLPSTKKGESVDEIDNIKMDDIKIDDITVRDGNLEEDNGSKNDNINNNKDELEKHEDSEKESGEEIGKTAQSFSSLPSIKFFDIGLKNSQEFSQMNKYSGYTESNLLGLMGGFIEKNLGEDNEILVTLEYDDSDQVNKIILKSREKGGENIGGTFEVYYDEDSHKFFASSDELNKQDKEVINQPENVGKKELEELYLSLF